MRSRVIPGSSPTIDRRDPTSRLKSVDLPTFGRPTIANVGGCFFADLLKKGQSLLRKQPIIERDVFALAFHTPHRPGPDAVIASVLCARRRAATGTSGV